MRLFITVLSIFVLLPLLAIAQTPPNSGKEERALTLYRDLVGFRTALGHEQVPVMTDYLVSRFKEAGFAEEDILVTDHESGGDHIQGLMVFLRAREGATQKPVVILGHMDVVDALSEDWERDPFALEQEGGNFFGRGTMDNKYGIMNLTQTFIRLKEEGWVPDRDIVLAFSGDEETALLSTRAQARYVAEHVDPAYVLNSDVGGGTRATDGTPLVYGIQAAEKTYATFEMTVTNPGGHSALPRADNAIYDLADALKRIEAYKFPVRHTPLTRGYFAEMGQLTEGELGQAMRAFAANPDDNEALAVLRANPRMVGFTGTTCVATMLRAGHAENALPQSATATVNCRVFPGETIAATEATLRRVVENEGVQFTLLGDVAESPISEVPDEVMRALEPLVRERFGNIPIVPYMESGGTDGMYYRIEGYNTVGISPLTLRPEDNYAHGLNERIPVSEFYDGLDHWYQLLKELAG